MVHFSKKSEFFSKWNFLTQIRWKNSIFFLEIDNHPILVNFNVKRSKKIRDMRNCRKCTEITHAQIYTLWLESKKSNISINFFKFSTLYKTKNVIYGEDSYKNVYGDLKHAKKCIGYSHEIFIQVTLGHYVVTFKMMWNGTLLP